MRNIRKNNFFKGVAERTGGDENFEEKKYRVMGGGMGHFFRFLDINIGK